MTTRTPVTSPTTTAFFIQAILSFVVAAGSVAVAVVSIPADNWVRAFFALGLLYLVTSTFTLAKCIRDRQEVDTITSRVDQARLDKLLAEHDPYKTPNL
ncbi:YiaA/YiaB family inner membrane protein [Actinomadura adrarensis]|uniref:YiaA/YiaB family inner membrane protein n=1 Tax=Actinomadura adrarensis TaxID=1819600 RepID=A0ABW3CJN9_9ACTN